MLATDADPLRRTANWCRASRTLYRQPGRIPQAIAAIAGAASNSSIHPRLPMRSADPSLPTRAPRMTTPRLMPAKTVAGPGGGSLNSTETRAAADSGRQQNSAWAMQRGGRQGDERGRRDGYYERMSNPPFPTESAALTLDGPIGPLDVAVDLPEPDVAVQAVTAIICHPLSTEGGSMHNKVVTMAARALRQLGITVVRFNFRSVGNSAGAFDHGDGEQDDLRAVAAWVRSQRPGNALWLGGFSFGAYVSLRAAGSLQPQALISIAPPAGRWDFSSMQPPAQWLVIQGDADEIVDTQAVYDWLDTLEQQPELVRMPDTSHFFHRKLIDLRGAIQHGVRRWLPAAV